MANAEQGQFVPIEQAISPRVTFRLPFPEFIGTDRLAQHVGVNLRTLNTICNLGGINHLVVRGNSEGEQSKPSLPQVVGFNQNGEAFAGKAGAEVKTPIFNSSISGDKDTSKPHSTVWANAEIKINTAEIANRISHEDKWEKGIRSPEAWTNHLNLALKQSVPKVCRDHLIFGLSKFNRFMVKFNIMNAILCASNINLIFLPFDKYKPQLPQLDTTLLIYFLGGSISSLMNLCGYSSKETNKPRFSLFLGLELDRALILTVLARTRTLAKAIPSKE